WQDRPATDRGVKDSPSLLACHQDPSEQVTCGGEAESFYPHQCELLKCCYRNHTCYHLAIDAGRQHRNAGILGGIIVTAVILSIGFFVFWYVMGPPLKPDH
ncbi:hypothetical protein lerEdw1_009378, partial [Lerista edwardsae]